MAKLSKTIVDKAELREKPYFIWCSDLSGFGVRVFPSGKRVYYCDYRADGQRRRMNIGAHGKVTTDEARKLAIQTLGGVVKGDDPLAERKTRRKSLTVTQLCDQYLEAAEAGTLLKKNGERKKATTLEIDRGRIAQHIKPLLGSKRVMDLTGADVAKFIADVTMGKTAKVEKSGKLRGKTVVAGGAGTASRTTGLLSGILSYGVKVGVITSNPAFGVTRPKDGKRERRLNPDELRALGKVLDASDAETWQAIAGIRLLAMTGCRLGEVVRLQWSEIDLSGQVLVLGDTKTGKSLRPLGRAAIAVLERLERAKGCPWVLPGVRDASKPFGGLDNAIERIMERAKLPGITAHILRHTFASVAADLQYSDGTIGALLGHAGHTVTSKYSHRLDAVLVAAANKVAGEVERQMTGRTAEVVELPGVARSR